MDDLIPNHGYISGRILTLDQIEPYHQRLVLGQLLPAAIAFAGEPPQASGYI
jgi:hypothetical protein